MGCGGSSDWGQGVGSQAQVGARCTDVHTSSRLLSPLDPGRQNLSLGAKGLDRKSQEGGLAFHDLVIVLKNLNKWPMENR